MLKAQELLPSTLSYAALNGSRLELTSQVGVGTTCTLHLDLINSSTP